MAKTNICTSMCICEAESPSTLKWRRVADMNRMGGSEFFYETPKGVKPDFIPSKQNSAHICDVRVLDWQMVDGKAEGNMNPRVVVYELAVLKAFQSVYMEDEAAIRNILEKGFPIPNLLARPFSHGTTALIVVIHSKTGRKQGLLFTDKSKLIFDESSKSLTSYTTAKISVTPADTMRSMHAIPIVDLDDVGVIEYQLPNGNGGKRTFLALEPETIGSLQPYAASKYIPIYLKRQLERSKSTIHLSDGRSLTAKDIAAIMDAVKESLEDQEIFSDLMQITDAKTAEDISAGIAAYLPSLETDMMQNNDLMEQIRDMLWAKESIRDMCLDHGRKLWQESYNAEREKAEAELAEIQKISSHKDSLLAECQEAETKLTEIYMQHDSAKQAFRESVQDYKNDLASLAAAYGIGMDSLPMVTKAKPVNCSALQGESFFKAMKANLKNFLTDSTAIMAADFAEKAISHSMHFGVDGAFAEPFAYALSIAMDGTAPATVSQTDSNCSAAELLRTIEIQPGRVVLVEGVLGYADDPITLAVARKVQNKTIVFSMDDPAQASCMAKTLFTRIALLNEIAQETPAPDAPEWTHAASAAVPVARRLGFTSLPENGPSQKLAEYQNKLARGKERL